MTRGRVLLLVPVVFAALACGDDGAATVAAVDGGVDAGDAGVVDIGPAALVRTNAPASSLSAPGPNNATLAIALGADGSWKAIAPRETGVYAVPFHGDRWTVAFVCADDKNAYVTFYDRAATLTDVTIELGEPCAFEPGDVGDVTGTFTHAPPATSWFDFGYVADDRGTVLPLTGDSAHFELVNILSGKWDFIFGFRDDSTGPLTKVFVLRDEQIQTETVLDADLAVVGVVPGSKALTITGLGPDEQPSAPMLYTVGGGTHGVDMGPQLTAGPNLTYSTVPPEQQRPTDRYRLALSARSPDGATDRGAAAAFHDATDLTIDLPAPSNAPSFSVLGTTPYLRIAMSMAGRASSSLHELAAITQTTERTSQRWTYSTDAVIADGATVSFEMPDFSAVPGWNAAWAILPERTSVKATLHEKASPLADGTLERYASHSVPLVMP